MMKLSEMMSVGSSMTSHTIEQVAALERDLAAAQAENAQLKQMLFRAYDYVGVPDDKHAIWGPIRAVLIARGAK